MFLLMLGLVVLLVFWIEKVEKRIDSLQEQVKLLADAAELAGKNIDWERAAPSSEKEKA